MFSDLKEMGSFGTTRSSRWNRTPVLKGDHPGMHIVIEVEQFHRVSFPQDPGVHAFDGVGYGGVSHSHRHVDQVDGIIRIRKPIWVHMSGRKMNSAIN